MSKMNIAVVGAGGFAREVKWLLSEVNRAQERFLFKGYVVSDLSKLGPLDSSDEVLGDLHWLDAHRDSIDGLVFGIGTPGPKLRLASELKSLFPDFAWPSIIHPTAMLDFQSCTIGEGAILCAGVIGTVNIAVEPFAMVNLSCTLGHEARLGKACVLNPTVNISGGVSIGEGALIGTGAQVLQYLSVGDGATVGAGAVVTKNVPPGITVAGIPAKPLMKKQE